MILFGKTNLKAYKNYMNEYLYAYINSKILSSECKKQGHFEWKINNISLAS